jgi:hypothetical protein
MGKAHDVLTRAVQSHAEREAALPAPTPVEAIVIPADCELVTFLAVGATPPDPSERVNVYLPRSLIERIDAAAGSWGMTRSSLFGLAATQLLNSWAGDMSAFVAAVRRK